MISAKEAREIIYENQKVTQVKEIDELIIEAAKEGKNNITLQYIPCSPVLRILREFEFCYEIRVFKNECNISW